MTHIAKKTRVTFIIFSNLIEFIIVKYFRNVINIFFFVFFFRDIQCFYKFSFSVTIKSKIRKIPRLTYPFPCLHFSVIVSLNQFVHDWHRAVT